MPTAEQFAGAAAHEGDAGEDGVRAVLQPAQHGDSLVVIERLSENVAIERHQRVRAEHQFARMMAAALRGGAGLAQRVEERELAGGKLVTFDFLGPVRIDQLKGNARALQQLAATRR